MLIQASSLTDFAGRISKVMKIHIRRMSGALSAAMLLAGVGMLASVTPASAQYASTSAHAVIAATTPTLFDLNGTYTDGGSARPVISDLNDILTVDMSSQHRPTASGVVISSDTIVVTFPDDATYGAKLVAPGTIRWSNGSTWRKLTFATVPDTVGFSQAVATSDLQSAGFLVTTGTTFTCDTRQGNVASQTPPGGTSAMQGSIVNIQIAERPKICQ
jgi:hypothetical protein